MHLLRGIDWSPDGRFDRSDRLCSLARLMCVLAICTMPITQAFSADEAIFEPGPAMNVARMGHSAVTLSDGRMALFGGHGSGFSSLRTAEIWSPETGFSLLQMQYKHDDAAFARLNDGRYLIAGGSADWGIPRYATSELFDPINDSFTAVGDMVRFRAGAGSAALVDGRTLIASAWWTHNDAHTYGELFDPQTRSFAATAAFGVPRAHAIVLPKTDGNAVIFGGMTPTGSSFVELVEHFDAATGAITTLRDSLFISDSGWYVYGQQRPVSSQRLADGRYLWMAARQEDEVTIYRLFTFNPANGDLAELPISSPLPDSSTMTLFEQPIVDQNGLRAYLVGSMTGTTVPTITVFSLDVTRGALVQSSNRYELDYYLSYAGMVALADGRLFISGGTTSDNFNPVDRTLFITPPIPSGTCVVEAMLASRADGGAWLGLLDQVRDQVLAKTPEGRELIDAYYRHGDEVKERLARSPRLIGQMFMLLNLLRDDLNAVTTANVAQVPDARTQAAIRAFATALQRDSSEALRNDLERFVEMDWNRLLTQGSMR